MPTTVKFGATAAANVTVVSDTEITADSPPGTGAVAVVVTTDGGSDSFDSFTYLPLPAILDIDPDAGPLAGGTVVTITGENLTGATGVNFGGTPGTAFTVVSDTEITVTTPAGTAGAVDVVLLSPNGNVTEADAFTYAAVPTVTGIDPDSGPEAGGTTITITGTNFQ